MNSYDDYEWNDLTDDVKERLLNEVREILESYYANNKNDFMHDLEFCQEYGCTSGCIYSTEKWQELLRLTEEENLDFYLFCKYDIANEYKEFAKIHKIA